MALRRYHVEVAVDGEEGYKLASRHPFDLLILDLMLPRLSGFEVFKKLRDVRCDGEAVPALPKEIDLARFLLENRGRVITRDELLLKVWEYPVAGLQTRTVDN